MSAKRFFQATRVSQAASLTLLAFAASQATPVLAQSYGAGPVSPVAPINGAPLYPETPGSSQQGPVVLRGESAGPYAANAAVARLVVEVDRDAVPADGQTPTQVTVKLFDAKGQPLAGTAFITIEASGGRILLPGARTDELGPRGLDADKTVPGVQLRVEGGVAQFSLLAPMTPQDVRLRITAGDDVAEGVVSFVPELREMVAAGLVEGVINLRGSSRDAIQPTRRGDAFERDLQRWSREFNNGKANVGARTAFFVKGVIKGDVLLTAAYDSDKETRTRLMRDVRPDEFYPVYGDSSLRGFDARSADRLYVRVDQGKSYLLYGDFITHDAMPPLATPGSANAIVPRVLGRYNRTMTGVRGHAQQDNLVGNLYATRDTLRQVVEEFASQGSGPYGLANNGALQGSEKVEVVVRDRNQPSRILSTRLLMPLVDYTFEPFSGRILLATFLPALDDQLNPVSLRVSYEVDQGGTPFWVSGGDVQYRPTQNLEVGGSLVSEDNPLARYRLASANAGVRVGEKSRVVVEVAQSRAEVNTNPTNQNTQGALAGQVGDVNGGAWRVEGVHAEDRVEVRGFVGRSDPTFVNPAAPLAGGRGEGQAKASYRLTDVTKVYVEGLRSEDRNVGGGQRNAAQVGANIKLTERLTLDAGLRSIRESSGTLGPVASGAFGSTSGLTGSVASGSGGGAVGYGNQLIDPSTGLAVINAGSFVSTTGTGSNIDRHSDTARVGLGLRATDRVTLGGEVEQSFAGDERRRVALGGDYRFAERTRLYGRWEQQTGATGPYTLGSSSLEGHAFVFGADSSYMRDTQVFSEYRLRDAASGRDLQMASGVRNAIEVTEGVRLSTALEHINVLSGSAAEATAAGIGVDLATHPLWRASSRLEVRHSGDVATTPTTDETFTTTLLQLTVARKLSRDWTALARNYLLRTDYRARGDVLQDRFQLGAAYRDTDTNRVNALGKVEYKQERDGSNAATGELRTQAVIVSTHADYHPSRPWWLTGRVAAKWQRDQFEGGVQDSFRAQLVAGRLVYDITENWDIGLLGALQTGQHGARQHAMGAEVGYLVKQNVWLSAGYNSAGFRGDADLVGYEYTQRGVYIRLRMKFDEDLFRGKYANINRSLDR